MIFDKKALIIYLAELLAMVAMIYFLGGWGFAWLFVPVFVGFAKGDSESLFWLLLMIISLMISNQFLVPKDLTFAISQRSMLVVLGFVMLIRNSGKRMGYVFRPLYVLLFYIGYMIIPSVFGWNPMVSLLKIFLFTMIFVAMIGISNGISMSQKCGIERVRSLVLAISIYFVVGSVLLVPFPGISQLSGEAFLLDPDLLSLFRGMTMHPQSLGPIVSSIAVLLTADLLFSIRKPSKMYLLILLLCPYLIYKTSSRTGMASYLLGLFYVAWLFMQSRQTNLKWKRKAISSILLVLVGLIIVFSLSVGFKNSVAKFAVKFDTSGETRRLSQVSVSDITNTRQGSMEVAYDNFKRSPLFGNGFQVTEQLDAPQSGNILSFLFAPIEKGVWVTAVLEEGGVIGFAIFGFFIVFTIPYLARKRAYISSSILFLITLTNLGEFTFFSLTYTGGFLWSMFMAGAVLDSMSNAASEVQLWPRNKWRNI